MKIEGILFAMLTLAPLAYLLAAQPTNIENRIDALLARMTLEEKLGQMSQDVFGQLNEARKTEIRRGRWGSLYGGGTAAERAEAQRIALKESRLRIPLVFGQDVIHGDRTVLPIPLAQAASWDPELVREGARLAAREASSEGIQWTFSPMIDIARDPRWGRISEGYGEDPYLASVMGAAMVRGCQGESLAAPDSLAACAKHFVGYGAAEAGRDYNTTWIPENLLRNVYLKPFLAAREAGAASFMSAFNALNGVPATGNRFTLTEVLRNEWKFDGVVVSDYTAVKELVAHGYAADEKDAALKAIRAGVDMEMVSRTYWDYGKALVESGELDIKAIDEAVRRILRMKFRLGLFDGRGQAAGEGGHTGPSTQREDGALGQSRLSPSALAARLAAESLVLLKNNGALPLSKQIGKVAVIGFLADDPNNQAGAWAGESREGFRTPLAALRDRLGDGRVLWAQGLASSRDTSRAGFAAAAEAARNADVALLFLGEEASLSGEAASRASLNLPGLQEELFDAVAGAGKPVITVIMAGRPLTFARVAEKSSAVIYGWHPGAMGGPAIADALVGDVSPSGKLPVTFPRAVGQIPIYYNHLSTGRPPAETGPAATDVYRSKYLDVSFTPAYPFGYGLSYSKFEYSNARISAPALRMGGKVTISADVANTGNREADEIVQFYTHQLAGSVARPVRELKGFERVHLNPGEKRSVEFTLGAADLAFYNDEMKLVTEPGSFEAWIAPDSESGVKVSFRVTE